MNSQKLRLIGDIHGRFDKYKQLLDPNIPSIQVGDYGIGFGNSQDDVLSEGYVGPMLNVPSQHRFIRGNHDNPAACKANVNWIPDGTVEGNIMFVGGGYSIDKQWRTEGIDYWSDEELSQSAWDAIIMKYVKTKPEMMVTHDCPDYVIPILFPWALPIKSITQNALGIMWHMHKPKYWFFGHWHKHVNENILGTQFVCLAELQYADITIHNVNDFWNKDNDV